MVETAAAMENARSPILVADNTSAGGNLACSLLILKFIRAQLPILSAYIEDQALMIVNEFKALSEQTLEHTRQMYGVMDLASKIELQGEEIPYERSIEILYEPLSDAIEKILKVSKLSMTMVMNIGNAAENIDRVESCINHVQALTKQTNMLALNTQIEAARTGEMGKSFRIIAQEVKTLSENIKNVSQQIQSEVNFVASSVRKSSKLIDNLAHYDMTENLELRDRVGMLIECIVSQNQHLSKTLQEAVQTSEQTGRSIQNLVVGIQFQDRSSQVSADLCCMLDHAIALIEQEMTEQQRAGEVSEGQVEAAIDGLKLSDVRNNLLQFFSDNGALSSLSDLYTNNVSKKAEASVARDDEDDIELF